MKQYLTKLLNHEQLSSEETDTIMLNITKGMYPDTQIAALLALIQARGVTVDEILGFRNAMMQTRLPIDLSGYDAIDIVGTGGDGKNTFNISTCACFLVAGAGYKVAKHGNFAATSVSGASTVLQQHGVKFSDNEGRLLQSLDESGVTYFHAPLFAKAMKFVGPVRKSLGFPTVFNLLGPLINPGQPKFQLLGVSNLEQMRLYTEVLGKLGIGYTVVSSLDGYDEISLTWDFKVATPKYEKVYHPEGLGFAISNPRELSGGETPEDAAKVFDKVLAGTATTSQMETVIANAAFAINTLTPGKSLADSVAEARESLESGKALASFKKFVEINS